MSRLARCDRAAGVVRRIVLLAIAIAVARAAWAGPSLVREVEPNGTSATATAIAGSSAVLEGDIFPNADTDFYSFTGTAGDRVYAATMTSYSASGSTDSVLALIGTDGATVLESDEDDGSVSSSSSSIAGFTLPGTGTFYLRVRHSSPTGQLRPYRLFFQQQSGAPTVETELNDTFPGQVLPAGGWVSGTLDTAADLDIYAVDLAAGDTVFLSLDLDPERDSVGANGNLALGLFGAPAFFLVVDDVGAGVGADSEAFFTTVKNAGTYGIRVGANAAGSYHLSASVFPAADEGVSCAIYSSTDVPVIIPAGPGEVTSILTVPGSPRIADLDVTLDLTHDVMSDLDVELTSPSGNTVGLFSDVGAGSPGGQTLMQTTIDDEGGIPVGFSTVVQGLTFTPEPSYRLSWFDGQPAAGTWTLTLRDDFAGDGGTLNAWSVRICEPVAPPECAAGFAPVTVFATDFAAGAAGFTHSGISDEWALGDPGAAPMIGCNSGTSCWKTDLFGTYNFNSNQDLFSPGVNLAGLSAPVIINWAQQYQLESATFDHASVDMREVANPTNSVRLWEWTGATMTNPVGNPTVTVHEAAGWGELSARADALAGLDTELVFHLDSNASGQLGGLAIDDVTVIACQPLPSDLAITKTDGVANAVPGTSVEFAITASHVSGLPATGASITDTFPGACASVTYTSVASGGATGNTAASSGNIADVVNMPPGSSITYTATCTIAASVTGTLANTATITAAGDPVAGNNSAADIDTLTPEANLGISKTNGVTLVTAGGSTTYTITASNPGPSDAPVATVTDTFPAGLTCTWVCLGAGGGTCTAASSGNVNDTVSLPAGGSVTYTASCSISAAASGSLVNTATVAVGAGVTDPSPGDNSATDTDLFVGIFSDGFESGGTGNWSGGVGVAASLALD